MSAIPVTPLLTPMRATMTDEQRRKRIRVRAAARRIGVESSYISLVARNGTLARAGVEVMRDPDDPRIVFFYEDELFAWWKARHPEWIDPGPE